MRPKAIVEEEKIEETMKKIPQESFTVLDFMQNFKKMYPKNWEMLVGKFGLFGSKRRYAVSTYLSNRLDVYSQKPHSILVPFTRYSQGKFQNYRKITQKRELFSGAHG